MLDLTIERPNFSDKQQLARPYAGPDRRAAPPRATHQWFMQMLDEIDYGMLLLVDETQVVHVNQAAKADLDGQHPLQLLGTELRARRTSDAAALRQALGGAARRGLRTLLTLGGEANPLCVAVVPLANAAAGAASATLLVFGKRKVCEALSVQGYARCHGLTRAETQVLEQLCDDAQPSEIAERQRVALSTVRSQIGSIRAKTGAESIRSLVRLVAVLPPLVNALRHSRRNEASEWLGLGDPVPSGYHRGRCAPQSFVGPPTHGTPYSLRN